MERDAEIDRSTVAQAQRRVLCIDFVGLKIIEIKSGAVRLGIEAPAEAPAHRAEVLARIQAEALIGRLSEPA